MEAERYPGAQARSNSSGVGRCGALLVAGVLLAACTVDTPQVPRVEFTVSVSVADDTTRIDSLVEGNKYSDFLEISDDAMALHFGVDLDQREAVGERLQVTAKPNTFSTQIGALNIPGQDIPEINVAMSDLVGRELNADSTLVLPLLPAPPPIDQTVDLPLANVTSLTIESGGLDIAIANGLPVVLENLRLVLSDKGDDGSEVVEVDALDLGTIGVGGSASGSFVLSGKTISGNLALSVTGGIPETRNLSIVGNPSLRINASLLPLQVSEARAIIPEQEFSDDQVLEFPDDRIQVTEASISEGAMSLVVTNEIPVIMEVELTLEDLRDTQDKARTFKIDSLSTDVPRTVRFDLGGNKFRPLDPLQIRLAYRAKTFETPTEVTIRSEGKITIQAVPERLVFDRVAGILDSLELPLEPVQRDEDIEIPRGLDNIQLAETFLKVYVTSAVGFNSFIGLEIEGVNNQGEIAHLSVEADFEAGSPDNPRTIVIEPESEELTDFLNTLPTGVTVTPTVLVGDGQGEEEIEGDHWVQVDSVVFSSPASFRILEDTKIQPDPLRRTFTDDDMRERIISNVRRAQVITVIENHVPLGVGVRVFVGADSASVYTDPTLTIPNLLLEPFMVDAASFEDGQVDESAFNSQSVEVDSADIVQLVQPEYWTGVQIDISGTNGDVALSGSDFIIVQAGAQIELELNEDLVQ